MNRFRGRLTYANVMSSIAVFLVLGGATALAAGQLGKHTVGTKQLKPNAVTTTKIKKGAVTAKKLAAGAVGGAALGKGAVTADKIGAGAVTGDKLGPGAVTADKIAANAVTAGKIAPGSVTGPDINADTTPFSRVAARLRGSTAVALTTTPALYPLDNATFTQGAGEDNQILGALDVVFPAGCAQPRSAVAYLVLDSPTPATFNSNYLAGFGQVVDNGSGTVARRVQIGPYLGASATLFEAGAATPHTFTVWAYGNCAAGGGINATAAGIDVLGTR